MNGAMMDRNVLIRFINVETLCHNTLTSLKYYSIFVTAQVQRTFAARPG